MSFEQEARRRPKAQRRAERKAAARQRAHKQRMLRLAAGAAVAAIALVAILVGTNRGEGLPDEIDYAGIPSEGRYLGAPNAPVDFVYYGDFQCPFCNQFDERDFPPLVENFVETGKVRVEWRAMPIISSIRNIPMDSPDNESVQSAEAAMCAADQGQFWPYADALYDAQGGENTGVFTDDMLIATAGDLGMDTDRFEECLASNEKHEDVMALHRDGLERGLTGTPTFLINDTLVSYSAEGYTRLEQQLEDELERLEASS